MAAHLTPVDGTVDLSKIDPNDIGAIEREEAADAMKENLERLYDLHYLMFAENRRALMIVLQGIDASGKDGAIRHLASGLNPQGMKIHSFKTPSDEELDHDYLWRIHRAAPGRGEVAIFNRSHYEEVTTVKVHPDLLGPERLPEEIAQSKSIFEHRYRQINNFEEMLVENGTVVLKFFLHISIEEQNERFQKRLADPKKHWKFTKQDIEEQKYWKEYMKAYEEMIEKTNTKHAPWYVVPANRKWYRNYLLSAIVVDRLKRLDMTFPTLRL